MKLGLGLQAEAAVEITEGVQTAIPEKRLFQKNGNSVFSAENNSCRLVLAKS